jgi:hypothetical protein
MMFIAIVYRHLSPFRRIPNSSLFRTLRPN